MDTTALTRALVRVLAAAGQLLFWGGIGLLPVLIWHVQTLAWDVVILAAGVVFGRVARRAHAWLLRPPASPTTDVPGEDPAWAQVSARRRAASRTDE